MHAPRLQVRCTSARPIGTRVLTDWEAVYEEPSTDGTARLNIRPLAGAEVRGVVFEIEVRDRAAHDAVEPRYTPIETSLGLTYADEGEPATVPPADWCVAIVKAGARSQGFEAPDI